MTNNLILIKSVYIGVIIITYNYIGVIIITYNAGMNKLDAWSLREMVLIQV